MKTATLPRTASYNSGVTPWKVVRGIFAFLRDNWLFTLGLVLLLALYLFGAIGSFMIDPKRADMGANPLNLSPTWDNPLGTEGFGRDMFTLMVIGISLGVAFFLGAVDYILTLILEIIIK